MKKLADGGGIYTLGMAARHGLARQPHPRSPPKAYAHGGAPNNGFFIDAGSKEFVFEANVVYATSGEAVRFNQCRREWHEWSGNFFGDDEAKTESAKAIIGQAGIQAPYR